MIPETRTASRTNLSQTSWLRQPDGRNPAKTNQQIKKLRDVHLRRDQRQGTDALAMTRPAAATTRATLSRQGRSLRGPLRHSNRGTSNAMRQDQALGSVVLPR